MEIRSYQKREIALSQLETALGLYFADGDLFSVVTLAGAAEEILAQVASASRGRTRVSIFEILRLTPARNEMRPLRHEDDDTVHMDLRQEAVFLLGRAIENYRTLAGELTPAMLRFTAASAPSR